MDNHACKILMLLFGAFLVVFTFVDVAPVVIKWITFGIGVILVLHFFFGCKDMCKTSSVKKKK